MYFSTIEAFLIFNPCIMAAILEFKMAALCSILNFGNKQFLVPRYVQNISKQVACSNHQNSTGSWSRTVCPLTKYPTAQNKTQRPIPTIDKAQNCLITVFILTIVFTNDYYYQIHSSNMIIYITHIRDTFRLSRHYMTCFMQISKFKVKQQIVL